MTPMDNNEAVFEIRRNPVLVAWVFFAALLLGAGIALAGAATLPALILALALVMLAPWWWVTRYERVVVNFSRKEASFVYSRFHPFREGTTVSLQGYTRVYASPFARNVGWSIHLSGRQGQHLLLIEMPSPFEVSMRSAEALACCETLARGLGITNGGDGRRP